MRVGRGGRRRRRRGYGLRGAENGTGWDRGGRRRQRRGSAELRTGRGGIEEGAKRHCLGFAFPGA